MTGYIITADHHIWALPELLSWQITYTGGVPCDCFSVTVPYEPDMLEKLHLAAGFTAYESGQVMLRGIVDEHEITLGSGGLTATVTGRGYAARLLDNESRPLTYQRATLADIIRGHVTPYGVTCGEMAAVTADTTYTVASGSSQWKALEDFCLTYGGFSPRFSREGKLLATPEKESGVCKVVGGETPVLSCTLRDDRYGVLTEVLVIDKTRSTSYTVRNQEMIDRGGQCRRVLYTPGQSTWAAMRYTGEYQITRSREDAFSIALELPGNFSAFPGDTIQLELKKLGLSGRYRVAEAENNFSPSGGATQTLILKERG